ncbi:MAG: I78 family peptidase inhibitor [Sphingosinicella sp.]
MSAGRLVGCLANTVLLLGCAPAPATDGPNPAGRCSTNRLSGLVGRPATRELGEEVLRGSGAARLRWIRPGDIVTMDYNPHRLNVHLDDSHRVERFACG